MFLEIMSFEIMEVVDGRNKSDKSGHDG